jgi:hypothetical protein
MSTKFGGLNSSSGSVLYRGDVTYLNKTALVYNIKTNFVCLVNKNMKGISNWLAAVKGLKLKEKDFTGSKGPQRNAVLRKERKKKEEEEKEEKHKKKKRINKPTN